MLKTLITALRLSLLVALALLSWLLANSFYFLLSRHYWGYVVRTWAHLVRLATGVRLEVVGKANNNYQLPNTIVVANHGSWLDTIILFHLYAISFVGKIEMKRWPLLSASIRAGNTIFINRENKRDILRASQQVSHELLTGRCVGLFPEGKVNDGKRLFPFKAPLLEAALAAGSQIVPIVLVYYRRDGTLADETLYYGKNLWQAVTATLGLTGLRARAIVLPTVDSRNFRSRQELAHFLHQQMELIFEQR